MLPIGTSGLSDISSIYIKLLLNYVQIFAVVGEFNL